MPQCVQCNNFFPPNYTEVIPNSRPDFEGNYPQKCIFCEKGIDKVERETTHGSGEYTMYTKEECIKDYKEFIQKLKDRQSAKEILKSADEVDQGFKI